MKNLIGIQFDMDEIRLAQRSGGEFKLFTEPVPASLVKDGQVVSPDALAVFLKEVKKKAGMKGSDCSLSLALNGAFFRTMTVPVMSESELQLNLPYEFRDFIGTDLPNYYFDYAVRSYKTDENGNPTAINISAAAVQKDMITQFETVLKKAGFRLKCVIPAQMALVNLVRAARTKRENIKSEECICHIGANSTLLCVVNGDSIDALKQIDIGTGMVDEAIGDIYGVDAYMARNYREQNFEDVLSHEKCHAVFDRLALEIMKTVNFFRYENPDSTLENMTFTGNCSWMTEQVRKDLVYVDLNVRSMSDWTGNPQSDNRDAEHCVLAIGAAVNNE